MEWRHVKGFEGLYEVNEFGDVRSLDKMVNIGKYGHKRMIDGRVKTSRVNKYGYLQLNLYKDRKSHTKLVHRLVAESFIDNPENKPTVNHKDANKTNNKVNNLEWATVKEQSEHVIANGLNNVEASKRGMAKLRAMKIRSVVCLNDGIVYESITEASKATGANIASIVANCKGQYKSAGLDKDGNKLKWKYNDVR